MIRIREESRADVADVYQVNQEAFGRPAEARLVDALRQANAVTLSLVAEVGDNIVGHILFSPVELRSSESTTSAAALGPMAVLPEHQGQGIGSCLVRDGLERLQGLGQELVFVLGHPTYYPRFGFESSQPYGIDSEFGVRAEVFMVAELRPGALQSHTGTVFYHRAFRPVTE